MTVRQHPKIGRREAAAIGLGAAIAAAIGGTLFALQLSLPRPSGGDRIAIDAYKALVSTEIRGSLIRFAGEPPIHARCVPKQRGRMLVILSNGHEFLVYKGIPRKVAPPSPISHLRIVAEAKLAGCIKTLGEDLSARLINRRPVYRGTATILGRPVYRLQIGRDTPLMMLLVTRPGLRAVAIEFEAPGLRGQASLITR